MTTIVVVGAQWGDEGKGKVTDFLASQADVVLRCQGGSNAGHTVVANGTTHKLHLIPSGILYPEVACIIGNGTVIDIEVIMQEIDGLQEKGFGVEHLAISERAHIILPYHYTLDALQEEMKADQKIGTTKRGIGPCYADKISRNGIRLVDLMEWDTFIEKLDFNLKEKNALFALYDLPKIEGAAYDELIAKYKVLREKIAPYVKDITETVNEMAVSGKKMLFEGSQGTLLDVDHGTYPFVTSSYPTSGGACTGSGVGPTHIDKVIGIAKAYTTRVGEGPFPTELLDEVGDAVREKGAEFGTTTGRPRRCGWFDAVVCKYATMVNGLTDIALTKLDVLDELAEIKICRAYSYKGEEITSFPSSLKKLAEMTPIYETMPGWQVDTTECKNYDELPENAKNYIERLEELSHCKISIVAVGPDREQTIVRYPLF